MTSRPQCDHGGGLDAAMAQYGGTRDSWIDLSTGINPVPYPIGTFPASDWGQLPDKAAFTALEDAARTFWNVPTGAGILAAPGASALIAKIPALRSPARVHIPAPTYNEHAASFGAAGWRVDASPLDSVAAKVIVHPNNPTGHFYSAQDANAPFTIIDESFCDIAPKQSLIAQATVPGTMMLKSFGKFWGLAGLRLGFAIGDPDLLAQLSATIGPWAVSGPALRVGAAALRDTAWASETRIRLAQDADRLDDLVTRQGAVIEGGTSLFRLYSVDDAASWQHRLAKAHIWSRIFPYSKTYIRLGLPGPNDWARVEDAL